MSIYYVNDYDCTYTEIPHMKIDILKHFILLGQLAILCGFGKLHQEVEFNSVF